MAVALEQFVKQIADSGVIAPGKLENFVPPKAQPKDAQELARQLVQSKHLTKYQAQEIYAGRAKSLILGNYTILDKIGAGGMGQVFKAEHRRMHRVVAIKMLPPAVTKDPSAVARFQREVEAAAKLRHSNIVAADDADEANGVHFLVMEFVDGADLSALVKKNGPFPVAKAVNYVLQAARGLEYAHGEGVVHRDIKPANLLVDKRGTVKILDMGLARISTGDDTATQAELTGTGAVLGTVDYMPPEQALSTKHADARADIYSLGCSLHYLITGKAAYDGDTLMAKLLAHREKPIPSLGAEVPQELQAVFEKMVAKKVEDRYQTMSDVVAALQECVAGTTTAGTQHTIAEPSSADSNLSFLAEATAHTQHRGQTKQVKQIKDEAKPAKKASGWNRKQWLLVGGGLLGAVIVLAAVIFKMRTKDGTLVVEVNQPDATVEVLNDEGKVKITQPGGKGSISISVDPGKPAVIADSGSVRAGNTIDDPAFQQWASGVAKLPAEQQVEAVVKKLQQLNPRFDGKETHKIDNGVVTEFRLSGSPLADIAPVRAFAGLRELSVDRQSDADNSLADLSQLAGMKLSGFSCLDCQRVSDLSPLRGMQLHSLNFGGTRVVDLSPLREMPLEWLDCGNTSISDLSPFQGMRLKHITFINDPVSDLSPLAGMPLESLDLDNTQVSRIGPVKGMPLRNLLLNSTRVSDLSPVAGMPLERLCIDSTPVVDLRPLRGLHLAQFSCRRTNVADLSPLRGMPLKFLECGATRVSDLSPLVGMPLEELCCEATAVSDFSPLAGMGLKNLSLTPKNVTKGLEVIRAMRSLEKIGISSGWDSSEPLEPADFWSRYDDGQLLPWQPGTVKEITALPPEQQLQAVVKKLQQLNPGFDGEEKHKIEGGAVTELEVGWRKLSDISPLRVLTGLRRLMVGRARVFDLEPLRGLPLVDLNCGETDVYDLSPLKGMKLTVLHCDSTPVADLSPLAGMPLASLNCGGTRVTDLRPLAHLPLANLNFSWTVVKDVSPLAGMPLAELDCSGADVADLSPLNGMHLNVLRLRGPSLAALAGARFKIDSLDCSNSDVSDLSPLKGIDIASLDCSKTRVSELAPLKGLRLWRLWCNDTAVHDLSPLAGMPLSEINLARTRVSDLSPLKQMQLNVLACDETAVADLAPLKGMPLGGWLLCNGTPVSDLSPLKGVALKEFAFSPTKITKGIEVIRAMNSLERIGIRFDQEFPAAEFWKKYDAGEFGKPDSTAATPTGKPITTFNDPNFQAWMKTVAAMPAEKQVEAVVKKLQELNPGFDGKAIGSKGGSPEIENGVVTGIGLSTDDVTDISPVRALSGLKALFCAGRQRGAHSGKFSDLSPLRGMHLTELVFANTQGSDISPLQGMPLTFLNCANSRVSDLSPLKGMSLTLLAINGTSVADLSPVKGMQLSQLYCYDTQISDLSALQGTHLIEVAITPKNITKGLDVIRQMKSLTTIGVGFGDEKNFQPAEFWRKYDAGEFGKPKPTTALNDPAFQAWMEDVATMPAEQQVEAVVQKLRERNPSFDGKVTHEIDHGVVTAIGFRSGAPVPDISPVRAFTGLKKLAGGWNGIADLSPLEGLPISVLAVPGDDFSDLSPLKGMPLWELGCNSCTKLSDLSPIAGKTSLRHLDIAGTHVRDLSPLRGLKLTDLRCGSTPITDLSPLEGMELQTIHLWPSTVKTGIDVVRRMKSIKSITPGHEKWFSPAEFWKKYDAGEFR